LQRARYYDPTTGEFTSRDPIGYTDGMSLYRGYQKLSGIDVYGLSCEDLPEAIGNWRKVPGTQTIYEVKEWSRYNSSLKILANGISGHADDWVCIWPIRDPVLWANYPDPKECARANVKNLCLESKSIKRLRQEVGGEHAGFLEAIKEVFDGGADWSSGEDAAETIKRWSGEGKTPIGRLLIGAHMHSDGPVYRDGHVVIGSIDAQMNGPLFSVKHIFDVATEKNNDNNSYESAVEEIGPPKCWFTVEGQVYGFACHTARGWSEDWAEHVMRKGSTAFGADAAVGAFYGPNRQGGRTAVATLNTVLPPFHTRYGTLIGDGRWIAEDGTQ
jgi:hypothetical protein